MHLNDFNINNESFDIKPELIISKIINNHSDLIYTRKNALDPYHYDLHCFEYDTDSHLGYIEVEVSNYEKLNGPKWKHSFLKRKVYEWDDINCCFSDDFKKYYEQTVYIKFSKNFGLTDCICCDIFTISKFIEEVQNKTGMIRKDMVYRTNKYDRRVAVGIGDCIRYIEHKFINFNKLDNWM